ncbi:hypothetical protein LOD99_1787 [Oopsacas minuta]|uniref:Uncharacterized protein n=1 Tax=Oopsacas minuta TaxID=111878 RepID=A0AAV7K488_9METZ|nr:hypothetical protein LOD99_1787 [Oopsacas minuta]
MPFGIPMIWREPTNHFDDCYFWMVKSLGFNQKNKLRIQYPSLPSAIMPEQHSDEIPISIWKNPELEPVITDCYQFLPDPKPENIDDVESPDEVEMKNLSNLNHCKHLTRKS